jgi:deferrochelatase/peroxidase EfeB
MIRSFVTVVVPFPPAQAGAVHGMLQALGPPFSGRIDAINIIHFMSMTVIAKQPADRSVTGLHQANLLIEFSADVAARPALSILTASVGSTLADILRTAGVPCSPCDLARFLQRHSYVIDTSLRIPWPGKRIVGLPFDGLPGMTVARIKQEEALARKIITVGRSLGKTSALATLNLIRDEIWASGDMKWAFEPLQAPFLGPVRPRGSDLRSYITTGLGLLWPILLVPAAACLSLFWLPGLAAIGVIALAVLATLLLLVLIYVVVSRALARAEARDPVDDTAPDPATCAEILNQENRTPLNLLVTVSPIKPDWFRPITLRLVLRWIASFVQTCGRPGFLGPNGEIGTLHAGRWIVLPGTNLLIFIAHYDGSWLSYMQDFVDRQPTAPTAIWTNTVGFPPTQRLTHGGVQDGDRVTRWFHNQQQRTDFAYAASPDLTLGRIRSNAAIRKGFASAETEDEAASWLALFGGRSPVSLPAAQSKGIGAPVPAGPDLSGPDLSGPDSSGPGALPRFNSKVPTLAYGTLSHRHHAACLVLQLKPGDPAACRAWLAAIAPDICYGPAPRHPASSSRTPPGQRQPGLKPILALGLSASGLSKLGMCTSDLDTFPASFVDGMTSPGRARVLGDTPEEWVWGHDTFPPDAVVLIYACDQADIDAASSQVTSTAALVQALRILCEVRGQGPIVEPFGFRDGLSQPVLPGTHAFTRTPRRDEIVAPGEFVLGYLDETGRLAPSPSVTPTPGQVHGLPPAAEGRLDIGRDSSFLVVRQLQQHKHAFDTYIADAANRTGRSSDDIAAKIIGRWRDGSSLVRHSHQPGGSPDNDFRYLTEDPDGLACPKGAHIRRANPRDALQAVPSAPLVNRHRLLRLGRPYVDTAGNPSGILFMCLNADIERQFELVQQAWMQNPNFDSVRNESDPLTGSVATSHKFTIPTTDGPVCLHNLPRFVTMLGGGYFWMPGKAAVEFLVSM